MPGLNRRIALLLVSSIVALWSQFANAGDIVRLKDGSFVRGSIVELEKGKSVTIKSATGALRTFQMDGVAYAGPDKADAEKEGPKPEKQEKTRKKRLTPPEPKEPEPKTPTYEVTFRVAGPAHGALLALVTGRAAAKANYDRATVIAYKDICELPCSATVEEGTHEFVIHFPGRRPAASKYIRVDSDRTVDVKLEEPGIQSGPLIHGLLLLPVGVVMTVVGGSNLDADGGVPIMVGGIALSGLGVGMVSWGLVGGLAGDATMTPRSQNRDQVARSSRAPSAGFSLGWVQGGPALGFSGRFLDSGKNEPQARSDTQVAPRLVGRHRYVAGAQPKIS